MMKMVRKKRNKKGFTLIELVVVIAILGILTAIAIPRLGSFRDSASTKADIAIARTILSAGTMAEVDKGVDFDDGDLNTYLDDITVTLINSNGTVATSGWTLEKGDSMKVYKDGTEITNTIENK